LEIFLRAIAWRWSGNFHILAYAVEKRISKHPEKFGQGVIEGVAGPDLQIMQRFQALSYHF